MVRPNGLFAHARGAPCLGRCPGTWRSPSSRAWSCGSSRGALSQFNDLQLATMAYYFCAVAGLTC